MICSRFREGFLAAAHETSKRSTDDSSHPWVATPAWRRRSDHRSGRLQPGWFHSPSTRRRGRPRLVGEGRRQGRYGQRPRPRPGRRHRIDERGARRGGCLIPPLDDRDDHRQSGRGGHHRSVEERGE